MHQGWRHRLVGDLEVTTSCELLELHKSKVRLDSRGVTIHQQPDGACRRKDRCLCVAIPMLVTKANRGVPRIVCKRQHVRRAHFLVYANNHMADRVILRLVRSIGSLPVVPHHTLHRVHVLAVQREGPDDGRHLCRCCIGIPGENGCEGTGNRSSLIRVIRDAHSHQDGTEVGVAEPERPVVVGASGNCLRGKVGHCHRDLEHHCPEADCISVALEIELGRVVVVELPEVQGCEVARCVVEEHVFAAWVRCSDLATSRGRVPFVDGCMELHTRISRCPCSLSDLAPEFTGSDCLHRLTIGTAGEIPILVGHDCVYELVGHPHRVIGILSRHCCVCITVEVRGVASGDEGSYLLLLDGLPVDERLDVWVVDVEDHHLCCTASGSA